MRYGGTYPSGLDETQEFFDAWSYDKDGRLRPGLDCVCGLGAYEDNPDE